MKDGEIYAYAVIDGFNGTWMVDFLEQFLLSNLYFDHLSDLSSKVLFFKTRGVFKSKVNSSEVITFFSRWMATETQLENFFSVKKVQGFSHMN